MSSGHSFTFLIIDDEPMARTNLLQQVGMLLPNSRMLEAGNVNEAREILYRQQVDGVFLDMEMPGGRGIDFLPEVRDMGIPVIITTAYEDFAVKAYEGDAADYLLKPVKRSRLANALARIRSQAPRDAAGLIVLADQNNCWPMDQDEIVMAESEGNYVTVYIRERKPIVLSRSLKDIEGILDTRRFVRANRSQIVRLQSLKQIRRRDGGTLSADLEGYGSIEFSRRQAQAFRTRFGV